MKKIFFTLLFLATNILSNAQNPKVSDSALVGDMIFTSVQVESEFEGGMQGWVTFIRKNLNGDVPTNNGAPAGKYTVEVSFVVDKEGNVLDIKAVKDPGFGTAQETIRVLKLSPKWRPGYQNGIAVKSLKKQKLSFVVEVDDVKPKKTN